MSTEPKADLPEQVEACDSRESLAAVLRPIREEHDQKHTSAALLDPTCPFCNGSIT